MYTFVFLAVKPLLNLLTKSKLFAGINAIGAMVIVVITVMTAWFFLRPLFPTTHALFDDWYNHAKYFSVLIFGYLLVHKADIWQKLINRRRALLIVACATYSFIIFDRHGMFESLAALYRTSEWVRLFYGAVYIVNMWCWLLVMVGYAGRYLNRPSKLLNYANQAVLPWYILHQTLIIVFAMMLKGLALPAGLEAGVILILTVAGCLLGYEIIRRIYMLNLLFGIKNSHRTEVFQRKISGYTG